MRYKQHTISKIEGQASKLKTLQRAIEMSQFSGKDAIQYIDAIVKELQLIVDRLQLEHDE
jgi:hypothetical protein